MEGFNTKSISGLAISDGVGKALAIVKKNGLCDELVRAGIRCHLEYRKCDVKARVTDNILVSRHFRRCGNGSEASDFNLKVH